jgi:hypothetical protein
MDFSFGGCPYRPYIGWGVGLQISWDLSESVIQDLPLNTNNIFHSQLVFIYGSLSLLVPSHSWFARSRRVWTLVIPVDTPWGPFVWQPEGISPTGGPPKPEPGPTPIRKLRPDVSSGMVMGRIFSAWNDQGFSTRAEKCSGIVRNHPIWTQVTHFWCRRCHMCNTCVEGPTVTQIALIHRAQ